MTDADAALKPCPFCGGMSDPNGWMSLSAAGKSEYGPECSGCGATAPDIAAWNRRAQAEATDEDVARAINALLAAMNATYKAPCGCSVADMRAELARLGLRIVKEAPSDG